MIANKLTYVALVLLLLGVSCKTKKNNDSASGNKESTKVINDDVIFGFMLGGMYPAAGFGGVSTVMGQIDDEIKAEKGSADYLDEMKTAYKKVFAYPFEPSQKSGAISVLQEMWSITDRASLDKSLAELIDAKHSKAWDLARYANVINISENAGYITKAEGEELIKKIVPVAKQNYDSWEVYMKDYIAGKKAWDPEDTDKEGFNKATQDLLTTKNSIYSYLKL